jgi:hypothetical protein
VELQGDLDDYFDPALTLKIAGIKYRIKDPNAHDGLYIRRFFTDPEYMKKLSDDDYLKQVATILGAEWVPKIETETFTVMENGKRVEKTREVDRGEYRGGVWSEMFDNGVTWTQVMRAGQAALLNTGLGAPSAIAYWSGGKGPKVPTPTAPTAPEEKNSPTESKASTGGTTRGRGRTTKKTPAAANQTP